MKPPLPPLNKLGSAGDITAVYELIVVEDSSSRSIYTTDGELVSYLNTSPPCPAPAPPPKMHPGERSFDFIAEYIRLVNPQEQKFYATNRAFDDLRQWSQGQQSNAVRPDGSLLVCGVEIRCSTIRSADYRILPSVVVGESA